MASEPIALLEADLTSRSSATVEEIMAQGRQYVEAVKAYNIDSPEMFEVATNEMSLIRSAEKRLEDARDGMVRPLNTIVKKINGTFKPAAELLAQAKAIIGPKMIAYEDRIAAERRAAEAAAAKQVEVVGLDEAFSGALATVEVAAADHAPDRSGHARRERYVAKIVSMPALLRYIADSLEKGEPTFEGAVDIKPGVLNNLGNATKGVFKIPGVEYTIEKKIIARS
jgi:hypothetical protein